MLDLFDVEPLEQAEWETNFEGLVQLLAGHLYSEPDVFIRELIQNSHDAIKRRGQTEQDLAGRIDIHADPQAKTITFIDNGIGMDRQELKDFLATIGSTGTGNAQVEFKELGLGVAYELVGQFGVGLLSAFVVADAVIIRTRRLGGAEAYAWYGSGSKQYKIYNDNKETVGTETIVFINEKYAYLLDLQRIRRAIIKYCDIIPYPISLNDQSPVNTIDAPWHRSLWASESEKQASYIGYVYNRFGDMPLDIIPIEIDEPYYARGVLYISDRHIPDINTAGVIDIFVRRFFVRGNDSNFLPPWAKFVRGVIDSPSLQTTTGRDEIKRESDPAFEFLRKRLGELIVERIIYLAEKESSKFQRINEWHHFHLKGMALYHDDFFNKVVDLLMFETNKQMMSLRTYLTKNGPRADRGNRIPIYYFSSQGGAAQFFHLADARGWVVINAGYIFETNLLKKYAAQNQLTVFLQAIDQTDDPTLFEKLDQVEADQFLNLQSALEHFLRQVDLSNVIVQARRYPPSDLPAIVLTTPLGEAEETLKRIVQNSPNFIIDGVDEILEQTLGSYTKRPVYLLLNITNPLIQKLCKITDYKEKNIQQAIRGLYNSAILYSQHLLTKETAVTLHQHFVELVENLTDQVELISQLQGTMEQERRQMLEIRQQQAAMRADRPEHILVFMLSPFSAEYATLELAVRRVLQCAPYYFEVRLARDYTHEPNLLDNIEVHIRRAHGCIAEISELNPNVMFELGAVMFLDDSRPVFSLRSKDARKEVPVDLKEKLFIPYASLAASAETLESEIRSAFERDGRIVHDGILDLLQKRKKRFLSRVLLESLSIRLGEDEIEGLLRLFNTVEDFIGLDQKEIVQRTSMLEYKIIAIRGELESKIRDES